MPTFVIIALLAIAFFHSVYVLCYWLKTEFRFLPEGLAEFNPATGVVLCLRGLSGQLDGCLQGLANQSRDFQLYCVFDSETDPAVSFVNSHLKRFATPPVLLFADEISDRRSLKCNSLLYALEEVDPALEVLAFIDSDVSPDPNWLGDLVAPLADDRFALTTGNRWFSNEPASIGNTVRQCWNAAAVVQMLIYRIAWGGSWAAKTDTIHKSGFAQHLEKAFCEDTALNEIFGKRQIFRVNSLVALNDDFTSLSDTMAFITRQLLTVRLYHRAWPLVLGHGVAVFLVNLLALEVLVGCIATGGWAAAGQVVAAICCLQVANMFSLYFVARRNESFLGARSVNLKPILARPVSFLTGALLSQLVHPYCAIRAMFLSRARWAGIDYDINGKAVKMVEYRPSRNVT